MHVLHHAFRLYIEPSELEATVAFYEQLQDTMCERRLSFAERGIEVAVVGAFVLLAGSEAALAPVRTSTALLMVDSLDETLDWLRTQGTTVIHEPQQAPEGRNATVRHRDGLVVEYYQATTAT